MAKNLSNILMEANSGYSGVSGLSGRWLRNAGGNFVYPAESSNSVVVGDNAIDSAAILELESNLKGFLPSRMTSAQRISISSPPQGLIVYDLTLHKMFNYTGSEWAQFIEGF